MERGELSSAAGPGVVFVFEELIAHLEHPRVERAALRAHKWDIAVDQWVFDIEVRAYIQSAMQRFGVVIEVLTWHSIGFAEALHDRLWHYDMAVHSTKSTTYQMASQEIAVNPAYSLVYDADPDHRFGYGFKCREFNLGQML